MISLFSQSPSLYARPSCNCPPASANFTFPESKGRIKGGREGGREGIWQFEGVTPADFHIFVDVILNGFGSI